jgi:hypothetical protein
MLRQINSLVKHYKPEFLPLARLVAVIRKSESLSCILLNFIRFDEFFYGEQYEEKYDSNN